MGDQLNDVVAYPINVALQQLKDKIRLQRHVEEIRAQERIEIYQEKGINHHVAVHAPRNGVL